MITTIKGDVTSPIGDGVKIIGHCCNDLGIMGAGVALAIKRKWPIAFRTYAKWILESQPNLGSCQIVKVEENTFVANIIGQKGIGFSEEGKPPVRYEALEIGLNFIAETALEHNASIHLPMLGAGLAGGDWSIIYNIISQSCKDVEVLIYEFDDFIS